MSFSRPFAYNNTGIPISGTEQIGNLAIGYPTNGFDSTGLRWWDGPDEELGYVIAYENLSGTIAPDGNAAFVQFWRTKAFTDQDFLNLTNSIIKTQTFTSVYVATAYLNANGYWTSFVPPTPTPTPTQTPTVTPSITASQTQTPTNTQTPSITATQTPTPSTTPTIVSNGLIIQLDAYNSSSYPGTGTTVYNLQSGSYNHTLSNAPYTVLNSIKCFDANGATAAIVVSGTGPTLPTTGYTYVT